MSVVGLDLVRADARQLHASASENPDLYWAARGGGAGFFAVATRYHLKLYPLARVGEVGSWLSALSVKLERSVELRSCW